MGNRKWDETHFVNSLPFLCTGKYDGRIRVSMVKKFEIAIVSIQYFIQSSQSCTGYFLGDPKGITGFHNLYDYANSP